MRTSVNLYVLETVLHLVGVVPAALSVAHATAALPGGMTLLGTDGGPPVVIDVALLSGSGVIAGSAASIGLLALVFLLASPLLLAGTVRSLGSPESRGPLKLLVLGAGRYLRFLLLHVAYLGLCIAATALLLWASGPLWGAFSAFVLVSMLAILRDLAAVVLARDGGIRACLSRIPAIVRRRPVLVFVGAVAQAAAVWLLVLGAVRLQLELHAETVSRAILLGLAVQALVLGRCLVRCSWLGALVRHDS